MEASLFTRKRVNSEIHPYLTLPNFSCLLGDLLAAIEKDFGSFDIFRAEMTAKTTAVEGSGWGWLVSGFIRCR